MNKTLLFTGVSFVGVAAAIAVIFANQLPKANQPAPVSLKPKVSLNGAGASFPAPLYQRWFYEYNKLHPNVKVAYQSVGSGAGVRQFSSKVVDFGASDVAMTDAEMAKVKEGVILLPVTAGSIVLAYNLPGIQYLKLSRETYVDIMLGKIKYWGDDRIQADNPGVQMNDFHATRIKLIVRSDGSGTTGVFTKHLSAISPEFAREVGSGKTVEWPDAIAAKGNEGVSAQVQQTVGAIGYVEFGFAKSLNIPTASLENKEGEFIKPTLEAATKSLAQTKLPDNLRAFVTDPDGKYSYPIVTYSWLLVYKSQNDINKLSAFKDVVKWAVTDGQRYSAKLGYIPLPENVANKVIDKLDTVNRTTK